MATQIAKTKLGDLSVYDQFTDAKSAINELAHDIAASGIMGASKPSQGKVLALECFARKIPPLALAQRYDIIHDKLSMKADAMRSDFEEKGASFRLIERTPDLASAELERDGVVQQFSLTWEEAKQEPFPYQAGKGVSEDQVIDLIEAGTPPKLKSKYRTPRSRMQMLWQRLVSDSVRAMDPSVVCGMYSPAEIEDFHENAGKPGLKVADEDDGVIDAEIVEPTESESEQPAAAAKQPAQSDSSNGGTAGMCSADQSNRIKELFGLLNVSPEKRTEILAKRKAATTRNLTAPQAEELTRILEGKLAARQASAAPTADTKTTTEGKTAASDAELAGQVRELLKQVNQVHPGTVAEFKAKLAASNVAKIDELRREDLLSLLSALKAPDKLEAYFGIAIWEAATKN